MFDYLLVLVLKIFTKLSQLFYISNNLNFIFVLLMLCNIKTPSKKDSLNQIKSFKMAILVTT